MECNVEFIKWMCEKADGFEWIKGITLNVKGPNGHCYTVNEVLIHVRSIIYPLLLQRAIEGVNKESVEEGTGYLIDINCSDIEVYHIDKNNRQHFEHVNREIDNEKESALKYIYEQEKK